MNKKGFTLIEGLMVIAVIGVLLLTLIPSVITIIDRNKHKTFEQTRDSIIAAAKMYVAENKYNAEVLNISCTNSEVEVSLDQLVGYGNLSSKPEGFPDVIVKYDCSEKTFSYAYDKDGALSNPDYSELTYDEVEVSTNGSGNTGEPETPSVTEYKVRIFQYLEGKSIPMSQVGEDHLVVSGQGLPTQTIFPKDYYVFDQSKSSCTNGQIPKFSSIIESYGSKVSLSIDSVTSNTDCTLYFEQD